MSLSRVDESLYTSMIERMKWEGKSIEREKKYQIMLSILTFHFWYAEAYKCHFMIGGQQWWDDYLCLSLRIF